MTSSSPAAWTFWPCRAPAPCYTPETKGIDDVDFGFIAQLARECPAKVIAEGHIHTPEQAVQALYAGAFALVVGGAITRPAEITARYTAAINNHK